MPDPRTENILFVTGRSADPNLLTGTLALAEELARLGKRVQILFAARRVPKLDSPPSDNVSVAAAGDQNHWLSYLWTLLRSDALAREFQPDVIHAVGCGVSSLSRKLARRVRKPYVLSVETAWGPETSLRLSRRWFRGMTATGPEVYSQIRDQVNTRGRPVDLVYSGVRLDQYPASLSERDRSRPPVVGLVGPLTRQRNHRLLLLAAQKALARNSALQFVLVGDGPERRRLRALAHELNIHRSVTFVHYHPPLGELVVGLGILVSPSMSEGHSLAAVHAMACWTPIILPLGKIAPDERGAREPLFAVCDASPDSLAEAILQLAADRDRQSTLGERARAFAESNLDVTHTASQTLDFYRRALTADS